VPKGEIRIEDLARLERRAGVLRERINRHGGSGPSTSEEAGELASLETAIAALNSARWRRAADEPIGGDVVEILAAVVDREDFLLLRRTTADRWRCECGCDRTIDLERIVRWRPIAMAPTVSADVCTISPSSPTESDAEAHAIVSPASYRGRKRLAIIDDRIQYLTRRAADLKEAGKSARFENDEIEALEWLRTLATHQT
jgi:hypothetical protein